jgi:predicted MFS family arabinose efflux permease
LFVARIGVGVGEAGCSPAAQSLIADMHPPERRATALGIYALGIPIGQLLGAAGGGWLAQTLGWRTAFFALGLAGLPLALIVRLVLREASRPDTPPIVTRTLLAALLRKPAFLHMAAGGALASFAGYALSTFAVSLLVRSTGLPLATAATWFGFAAGAFGAIGTFGGGWLADRLGARGLVAGGGLIVAGLLYPIVVLQTDPVAIGLLAAVPMVTGYFYFGPLFATTADCAEPGGRAGAVAVLLFVMNAVGLGLGPLAAGALSDHFAAGAVATLCSDGTICAAASAIGLRHALAITSLVYLWAGAHFLLGGRALKPSRLRAREPESV